MRVDTAECTSTYFDVKLLNSLKLKRGTTMEPRAALEAVLPGYDDMDTLDYMAEVLASSDADDLEDNLLECVSTHPPTSRTVEHPPPAL